jgi:hypothetical protein
LLSPRHEIAQIAASLYHPLLKRGISLLPIVIEAGIGEEWIQVEEIFNKSKIVFKSFSEFHRLTALQILIKEKPRIIVTDNDLLGVHNAFVLSGKYLGIPVVVIRESTYNSKDSPNFHWMLTEALAKLNQIPRLMKKYLFYIRSVASVNPRVLRNISKLFKEVVLSNFQGQFIGQYADYILANTKDDADFLKKHCPKARFVRVVGNPIFDYMLKNDDIARTEILRMFKIPEDQKIVLFLSGAQVEHGIWTKEQKILANQSILNLLESISNQIHVIIKLHPMEQNLFYLTWKPDYDDFMNITKQNLNQLIQASDVVITWPSTAMLDIILAGKPLIVMDFYNQRAQGAMTLLSENAIDQGAAYEVFNTVELSEVLTDIIADGKLKEKLQECERIFSLVHLTKIDGKSNERIADCITEAIQEYYKT